MRVAGGPLVGAVSRPPAGLDAVVGVVGRLERGGPIDDVAERELPARSVRARVLERAKAQLLLEASLEVRAEPIDRRALRHRVAGRAAHHPFRQRARHVDRDEQTQVPRRRREVLPVARRLEDLAAVGHVRGRLTAREEPPPILDGRDARLDLFFERLNRLEERLHRIERRGGQQVVDLVVKAFDAAVVLVRGREVGQLRVVQPPESSGRRVAHQGSKSLEPRAAEDRIHGKEKVPAPEALSGHGAVGLSVDGQQDAARRRRLWQTLHDDEHVAVRIGEDGAGAECLRGQGDGVVVARLVFRARAPGAGLHRVRERRAEELTHPFDGSLPGARVALRVGPGRHEGRAAIDRRKGIAARDEVGAGGGLPVLAARAPGPAEG